MRIFILLLIFYCTELKSQSLPVFGSDVPVTINGYTLDAMEPCISPDGNALFFNSINNGTNTSLYYAAKVDDSTFNLVGLVPAVNEFVPPYLNAVASLDTANNFFWVSSRGYPGNMDNLFRVTFTPTAAVNFARVHGNIYTYAPGHIIMDASITKDGSYLYYCSAWFNSCTGGLPCSSRIGIGQKINDSTFNVIPNSNVLLGLVNDTNYIVYAPELTHDGLELYFTRALVNSSQTEICVSLRSSTLSAFSTPTVLINSPGNAPEAATINSNKTRLYYHKISAGKYRIFLRKRSVLTGINEPVVNKTSLRVFPNPSNNSFTLISEQQETFSIVNQLGVEVLQVVLNEENGFKQVIVNLRPGIYLLNGRSIKEKIIITAD